MFYFLTVCRRGWGAKEYAPILRFTSGPPQCQVNPTPTQTSILGKTASEKAKNAIFSFAESNKSLIFKWLQTRKRSFYVSLFAAAVFGVVYYVKHLEETPITKRVRHMSLTRPEFIAVCEKDLKKIKEKHAGKFIPASDARSKRVVRILTQLICRNPNDIPKEWHVAIFESNERHVMSLSIGYMFISTGLLEYAANDDQLGVLLGHELAHAVLLHDMEKISWTMALRTLFKGFASVFAAWFQGDYMRKVYEVAEDLIIEIISNRPYGRLMEEEADEIGLQLAAKACFDPRAAYAYWAGLLENGEADSRTDSMLGKFMFRHPGYGDRADRLEGLMQKMCEIRTKAGCPPMSKCDPCELLKEKTVIGRMDAAFVRQECPL